MTGMIRLLGCGVTASLLLAACGGGSDDASTPPNTNGNSGGGVTQSYTVTTSVTGVGSISPTAVSVASGATTTFTLMPNSGHQVSSVTGCGGTLSGATYTTGAIASACTVTATFTAITVPPASYTVSTSVNGMGTITPTSVSVVSGGTTSFTLTPSSGYQIASVSGCGGARSGNTFTTGAITSACTVTAIFNVVSASSGFGPQSSTFAATHGFDFAETFDGLADWGPNQSGYLFEHRSALLIDIYVV